MTDPISPITDMLLWSRFGGAELIIGLIVGLMMLAFALPARLDDETREPAREERTGFAGPRRG